MRQCSVCLLIPGILPDDEDWQLRVTTELPPDAEIQAEALPLFNSAVRAAIVALLERHGTIGVEQSDRVIASTESEAEPIDSPNQFAGFSPLG